MGDFGDRPESLDLIEVVLRQHEVLQSQNTDKDHP